MRNPSSTLNVLSASAGSLAVRRGSRSLSDGGGSAASSATALATIRPVADVDRVVMWGIIADAGGEGNRQSSGRPARLEQVPNLRQQFLVLGQWRGLVLTFAANPAEPGDELNREEEERQRHDQEVDDLPEEQAVRNLPLAHDD